MIIDETTTARTETKDKARKERAPGGDGGVRANAARATAEQESKERAEREASLDAKFDRMTQAMQDLNQRFNSVTPQDSVSNVGAQSSAGSTELAQPMRTANAAQLSNAMPNSLNYVMPGSNNHMSHASLFQLNGRQVRGAILSSSNGERKIHFSSMCILAEPDLDKPEARRDPEHALPPAQIDDTFDVSEDAESMSPISSSSLPSPPAPCRRTFHLRLDDH